MKPSPATYIKILVFTNSWVYSAPGTLIVTLAFERCMATATELARVDRSGMLAHIQSTPDQLRQAYRAGRSLAIGEARRVAFVGMGGSAIAADVFCGLARDRSPVPLEVVRDGEPPPYLAEEDVLVAVSYSGDTQETVRAAQIALRKGCRLIAVISGGKLRDLARAHGAAIVEVPPGLPPRAAFGHLFGAILGLASGWLPPEFGGGLESAARHLERLRFSYDPGVPAARNRAKALARAIRDKTAVVYGAPPYGAVAFRWKTQLNENAKVHAFAASLPEANHNELVGWSGDPAAHRFVPVLLRDPEETADVAARLDLVRAIIGRRAKVREVRDDGETRFARVLGTLFLGDYVSLYLAVLLGRDPTPTPPIGELKRRLARRAGKPSEK